jgi:iron complex transport system permease protein
LAEARKTRPALVLGLLALGVIASVALFMTLNARGSWDFVLPFRGRKLWGLLLVAYSIAVSTVLFQTVTENRILTPAIMGFDFLYRFVQTALVFSLGSLAYATFDPQLKFIGNVAVMMVLSMLLFRWLFGSGQRNLHLLVLAGIVFGVLFRSVAGLMQRMIDPNEFVVLQDMFFARFSGIDPSLLMISTVALGATSLLLVPLLGRLDVMLLGRDTATNLGVDHTRTVQMVLAVVAVMVSVSTALVGPVLFFGLLVANLAYLAMPSYKHALVLPAAVLIGIIGLVGGQTILEHVFKFDTALSIIIEFVGGITFLFLLLRRAPK